jgi:hypothetical protein
VWVRREKEREMQAASGKKELPWPLYLVCSALVAIAAVRALRGADARFEVACTAHVNATHARTQCACSQQGTAAVPHSSVQRIRHIAGAVLRNRRRATPHAVTAARTMHTTRARRHRLGRCLSTLTATRCLA